MWPFKPDVAQLLRRKALSGLTRALAHKDPKVRSATVAALAQLGDREAFLLITQAISDDDVQVRDAVTRALEDVIEARISDLSIDELGMLGPMAEQPLGRIVHAHPVLDARLKAAKALGKIRTVAALKLLADIVSTDTHAERIKGNLLTAACAEALGEIGDALSVPVLLQAL